MDKKKNGRGPGMAETIVLLTALTLLTAIFKQQISDAVTAVPKIIGCITAGTGKGAFL